MGDLETPDNTMKSVNWQRSDKTLEIHTRKADQKRLAEAAMTKLSGCESSVRGMSIPAAANE